MAGVAEKKQERKPKKKRPEGDSVSTGTNEDIPMSCFALNKKSCKRCWCSGNNKYWRLFHICNGLLLPIIFIGGGVFSTLERGNEQQMVAHAKHVINHSKMAVMEMLMNHTDMNHSEVKRAMHKLIKYGVKISKAHEKIAYEENPVWDWSSAVFFSVSVITTVGYGSIAPKTPGGQIFFMFYSIIGIPIALLFLSIMGQIIKAWADRILRPIEKKRGTIISRLTGTLLLFLTISIFLILIPGIFFDVIERWNYCESVYFAIASLTTVGFGDLVPGRQGVSSNRGETLIYKFICAVWLWIGLGLIAGLVTEMLSFFEAFEKWWNSRENPLWRFFYSKLFSRCRHKSVSTRKSPQKVGKIEAPDPTPQAPLHWYEL